MHHGSQYLFNLILNLKVNYCRDVAEAGFMEPRPKPLKIGFNVRADGNRKVVSYPERGKDKFKGDGTRKGVSYPKRGKDKFKGEVRMGKLGKCWLGRECLLEAMMLRYDIGQKCVGNESIHFDHADYFQFFEYDGVVYNDKSKLKEFLKQSPASEEARTAFRKFVKGEIKRIMGLPVIKSFLNKLESASRREEESPMQAGAAHSGSSQPASMVCVETHYQYPPVKSYPPLDRSDAVLGSLDGQQVHKKGFQPMPEIEPENFTLSSWIDFRCNDLYAMPMERGNLSGVQTSSPSNDMEHLFSDFEMSEAN